MLRTSALALLAAITISCGDNHDGNTAPTIGSLALTTDEDTPLTRTIDTADNEGNTVTITLGDPAHGTVTRAGADGFTYVPDADYHGPDSFEVAASDGVLQTTGTVSITVVPVNDAPTGLADSFATTEDTAHVAQFSDLLQNDGDPDGDTLTITSVGDSTNGFASIVGQTVVFTPGFDFEGTGNYRYTLSDGTATSNVTVTITIGGVNDPPIAGDDFGTIVEDGSLVVTSAQLVANDFDPEGQTLTVQSVASGTGGTVALVGTTVTFTPTPNFNGAATFTYVVTDGSLIDTATVNVTITAVNDPPVAGADSATTNEDTPVTVTQAAMLANDTDIENQTLSVTSATNPVNGTIVFAAGDVTFTPTANFIGTGSFQYTVSDGGATATGTVTITIVDANDAPVAIDDMATTLEDAPAVITSASLVANDLDIDGDTLAVQSVGNASVGTVLRDGGTGEITFTPPLNFAGSATFDYVVTDGALADTGRVTVVVTAVNDPPIATNDTATAESGVAKDFALSTFLANDTDADLDTLTITAVSAPSDGATVSLAGATITYTALAGFTGAATFQYTLSDGNGGTATGTVTVAVSNTNSCGDGVMGGAEACDDNNLDPNDGCDGSCQLELGWTCNGQPSVCVTTCGDGTIAGTEVCDDNNQTSGDGCDANCTPTGCNNGIVTAGEACDDGDADSTDGCTTQCSLGVICNATAYAGGDRFAVDALTGACYVSFDTEQTTFAAARTACTAIGGYLTTITSAAEQAIVRGVQNQLENPWIGALDDANTTDAVFTWVTAEPFTFTSFDTGEPDDDAGLGGNGDCLHLNANGLWADTNCNLATFVSGRICEIETQPCGDGVLQAAEQCDDGNVGAGDGCSATCTLERMTFSEYVEGSSFNKALEIRNPLSTPINLLGCSIAVSFNGGTSTGTFNFPSTTVAANDVFVVCNNTSGAGLLAVCDLPTNSSALTFNGDDAISLVCAGATLDIIGQIGTDPGTEWGSGLTSTSDNSLRRSCAVTTGDTNGADAFSPATEWTGFAADTFAGLGDPTCAP